MLVWRRMAMMYHLKCQKASLISSSVAVVAGQILLPYDVMLDWSMIVQDSIMSIKVQRGGNGVQERAAFQLGPQRFKESCYILEALLDSVGRLWKSMCPAYSPLGSTYQRESSLPLDIEDISFGSLQPFFYGELDHPLYRKHFSSKRRSTTHFQ